MTEPDLLPAMKRVVAALKHIEVPFVLAGGFAVYARGGAASDHDVDFLIREQDVERALAGLAESGLRTARPPEDWLVKVYDDEVLIDLIFRPVDRPVTDETLADCDVLRVLAITVPVLSATTLMVHKLLTFSPHHCEYAEALPIARSLREQIDWDRVRKETVESPYARAFMYLLDQLELLPEGSTP